MPAKKLSSKFINFLYNKLFKINDSPHKIALGFGLGVFSGILPGTGLLVSLFLAFIFRTNRASALAGCLATNTWLSFVTFILAIKVGATMLGISWQQIYQQWISFLKEFHWLSLFKLSILKIALPIILGYLVISFILGITAYFITLIVILKIKSRIRFRI